MAIALLIIVGIAVVVLGAGWLAWQSTYGYAPPSRYTATRSDESYRAIGLLGGLLPWQADHIDTLTEHWARDGNYRVTQRSYDFWRSNRYQVVQRITVRDRYSRERHGYLRSPRGFFGIGDGSASVEWDEPAPRERWRR